jgi:D-alanyl-D-alanine carboxypeptidase
MRHQIIAVVLLIGGSLVAQPAWVDDTGVADDEDRLDLTAYLENLDRYEKAMTAVAIAESGEIIYQSYNGMASIDDQLPIDADTKFRVGSITKTVAAVLVMQLVEQDKLQLDTPLSDFYPEVKNAELITIEQLLRHRSGIFSFTDDPDYMDYMTESKSREEMLAYLFSYDAKFEPGSQHGYSNSNYLLLGYILEDITDRPFSVLVDERIVTPLGLTNTRFGGQIRPKGNEAISYVYGKEKWQPARETDMSIPHAAGALVSTAADLTTFITALFQGRLVSTDSVQMMITIEGESSGGYGLGIMRYPFGDLVAYGHNGGIDGFRSHVSYLPGPDVSLAVISNAMNYGLNQILIAAGSYYFEQPFAVPDFTEKPIVLSARALKKFKGWYGSDALPLEIKLWVENKQLMAQATGQGAFPLTAFAKNRFKFEGAGLEIVFDETSGFVLKQGGGEYLFQKMN